MERLIELSSGEHHIKVQLCNACGEGQAVQSDLDHYATKLFVEAW
jgi:hypothetical protein